MSRWLKAQTYFKRPIYVCMEDEGVSSGIIHHGNWESHVGRYLVEYLEMDAVFLDIGANVGFFTLLAAHEMEAKGGDGRVIAVEANPIVLPYLMASIVESGLEHRIDVLPYAVAQKIGIVQMQEAFGNNLGGVPMNKINFMMPSRGRKIVPTVELDDMLIDLTRLDLIKMDIEGAESLAIDGMMGLLEKFSPDIICEINKDCLQGVSGVGVLEFVEHMEKLGYTPHSFEDDIEYLAPEDVVKIVDAHNYYDFLFVKNAG